MRKHRYVLLTFFFLLAVIAVKLFYLQVLNPNSKINNNYLKYQRLSAERGKIYDSEGEPFVLNTRKFLVFAEPKKIKDRDYTLHKLDDILKLGEATISARVDPDLQWVAVDREIDPIKKKNIEKLNLQGIGFQDEYVRYYPEASLAAHLTGFVGKNDSGENLGYFGLEGFYDKDLSGLPGILKTERDLLGRAIFVGTQEKIESENGRDLYLTIDKSIQHMVKRVLLAGIDRYKAKEGCIIVANPKTMEIVALSCLPDFDVEKYYKFSEEYFKDPAISSVYEPGSTFKPLIIAAALNEKKIKPLDTFNEGGSVTVGGYTIKTWNDKYEGKISITRILEKSSNVGMVWVGQKLGDKKLYKYIQDYGFGNLTAIDLQGEIEGNVKARRDMYPIDYATSTFGQGIAVTPIQLIRAFSSLVNGGNLMRPYVVKKIVSGGQEKIIQPHIDKKVITEQTSEIIKKMLESTVVNSEAKWDKPEGYRIGGKTGTAQIPIKGHYDSSRTIASFIGFAPVSDPRFIALVILKEPGTSIYGSETAAPLFFDVARQLLVYYNIPPER